MILPSDAAAAAPRGDAVVGPRSAGPAATPQAETTPAELERALSELGDAAFGFAHTPAREKAALLRSVLPGLLGVARAQVDAACAAKGIDPASPSAGEEWLSGPVPTLMNVRLLAEALEDIDACGRPLLGRDAVRIRDDGRVEVDVFPPGAREAALYTNIRASVVLQAGATGETVVQEQARFYQQTSPEGGVSLVLGAGNVASIPPMDALHRLFVEGRVVILKMSPVNAYLGPLLERALSPLVARGVLRIVYGGAQVGAYLAAHRGVADVHITGSAGVHDRLVWGPPGREQARRRAAGERVLAKPITSELGNVSPVLVMPFFYDADELWFQVRSLATQLVNNASFNCNAAKMLVLPRGFAQRPLLFKMLRRALASVPPRRAYYPGAQVRHKILTTDRPPLEAEHLEGSADVPLPDGVVRIGDPGPDALPWTLISGLDADDPGEPLFSDEPFCSILSIVEVGSSDPVEFLAAATRFCNERLWGTLSASIVAHPSSVEDPVVAAALDRALLELRYGAIAVNQWPAYVYGTVVPPWGGHPSATLANVQSGIGFVHNPLMLGRIEKTILRAPLMASPRPPIFYDHRRSHLVGERLATYAARPGWGRAAHVAAAALRG
jgi:acyl-CoA reductase-like NAD-dependent aldehyde dehydrogenase